MRFFHLAGNSALKGTDLVLECWRRHGITAPLTVVGRHVRGTEGLPASVTIVNEYMDDRMLASHAQGAAVHICTSVAEGYGIYADEAAAMGRIVIIPEGSPLGERFGDVAVRVPVARRNKFPKTLGSRLYVDVDGLHAAVENILAMPAEDIARRQRQTRQQFERRHALALGGLKECVLDAGGEKNLSRSREMLPKISAAAVVTLTRGRGWIFPVAVRSWRETVWDEGVSGRWVIVVNGEDAAEVARDAAVVRGLVEGLEGITVVERCVPGDTVGEMRNFGCKVAWEGGAEAVVFMDDDD